MVLALYLILSLYLGRKNPFYFLLVIFALQQGQAAFIDQNFLVSGKKVFSIYDHASIDTLFVGATLLAIFAIKAKVPKSPSNLSKLILFILLYYIFLIIADYVSFPDSGEVLLTGRQFLYIPLSYFLWLAIFSSVKRTDYEAFLLLMCYVTPVSSVLYILNSSQVFPIFDKSLIYSDIEFGSSSFFRDFRTIPIYIIPIMVICIQSLLIPVIKIPRWLLNLNLVVLPIALLFTFTRSIFVAIGIQVGIMLFIYYLGNPLKSLSKIVSFVSLFIILAIPAYIIADKLYPDQMQFLFGRFSDASTQGVHEQNVDVRLAYLDKAIEITNKTNPILGVGMNKSYYKELDNIGAWIADSTIPFLLYHTGWLGVVLIYSVLLYCSVDSIITYIKTKDWLVAYLASVFVATFIGALISGGGILTGSVWALTNIALYITVKFNLWKKETTSVAK